MTHFAIRLYDAFGENYERHCKSTQYSSPSELHLALQSLGIPTIHQKVLDVGIGTGKSSKPFKEDSCEIYGVDGSSKMIDICRREGISQNICKQNLFLNPEKDIKKKTKKKPFLQYEDSFFDIALSNCTFRYLPDFSQVLREMARVVRRDGTVAFTTTSLRGKKLLDLPNGDFIEKKFIDKRVKEYIHNPINVRRVIKSAGLELLCEKEIHSQFLEINCSEYCNLFIAIK